MAWSTVGFLVFLILMCFVIARELIPYCFIQISARRIGLRDKGYTGNKDDSSVLVHEFCETRTRIGIDKQGTEYEYCWKCERIFSDDPDPGEKEPAPVECHNNTNVIPFKRTGS